MNDTNVKKNPLKRLNYFVESTVIKNNLVKINDFQLLIEYKSRYFAKMSIYKYKFLKRMGTTHLKVLAYI